MFEQIRDAIEDSRRHAHVFARAQQLPRCYVEAAHSEMMDSPRHFGMVASAITP
jgi:hypothetical protein